MKTDQEIAQHTFLSLKLRLATLPERAMRREIFGETLLSLTPSVQAELLHIILQESGHHAEVSFLLTAFQDQSEATHRLRYEQIRDIYEHAHSQGYTQVQRLLLTTQAEAQTPANLRGHPALRGMSLGMRKSMARKTNPALLEKLLLDPDPTVIYNLLRNPRITEKEVLRICSRRPNHPDVLREISRHERWSNRYSVKLALAQNPDTPLHLALSLLPQLTIADLERIAATETLAPPVLFMAQDLLAMRETTTHVFHIDPDDATDAAS